MERLFLSVPATVSEYDRIKETFSGIISGRWVPAEALHVTIYYFGDTFKRADLIKSLTPLVSEIASSDIIGVGYFTRNDILYAKTQNRSLEALFGHITKMMGLPVKGAFVPHVTLMRVRQVFDSSRLEKHLRRYDDKRIGRVMPHLQLMQSHLHPDGARYGLIKRFGL